MTETITTPCHYCGVDAPIATLGADTGDDGAMRWWHPGCRENAGPVRAHLVPITLEPTECILARRDGEWQCIREHPDHGSQLLADLLNNVADTLTAMSEMIGVPDMAAPLPAPEPEPERTPVVDEPGGVCGNCGQPTLVRLPSEVRGTSALICLHCERTIRW